MTQHKKTRIVEKILPEGKEKMLSEFPLFLSKGKFINIASCSMERMPNVAPKLIASVVKNIIYCIDYNMGKTYANLKENPRISISFIDEVALMGYQLNGSVDILEEGVEFDKLSEEFKEIKTKLTVERILLDLRTGKRAEPLEFFIPEKFVILKIKIIDIVEISSNGILKLKIALT